MAIVLCCTTESQEKWVAEFRRQAPDLDFRVWPEAGDLAEITHWVSVVKITPDAAEDPTISPDERARGQDMASRLPMRVLTRMWQMLLKALDELTVDAVVLRAPRGLLDEPAALYAPGYLDDWAAKLPSLRVREVPDVNHYTIVMGEAGAAAVAESVREALAGS